MAGHKNSAYFFIIINKSLTSTSINLTYTFSIFATRRLRFMSKNEKNLTIYKVDAETFITLDFKIKIKYKVCFQIIHVLSELITIDVEGQYMFLDISL